MAEFMMIPEVFVNEHLRSHDISGKIKMESTEVEKLIDVEDPLETDPLSLASDVDFLQVTDGLHEDITNCEFVAIKECSDFEEHSSSFDSSHSLEAKREIYNNSCDSYSEEDESIEEQHKLYEPLDETYMNNIRNKKKSYECPICNKGFKTTAAMNGHIAKTHKATLGEKFICHVCGAPGSSRASLKRHLIRTHKIFKIDHPELLTKKCCHCDIGFATHKMKYEHIRSSHGEQLKLYNQCQWCPALMKAKASLVRHVRRAHPGKEHIYSTSVSCYICNLEMVNIPMLQRHMKKEHPLDILHKCNLCTASFKFPYMLAKHKVCHENPAKYLEFRKLRKKYSVKCDNCLRKFDSKSRLSKHIENVHSIPLLPEVKIYSCRLCDSSFQTAKQNSRHYRRVHRPLRQKIHCGKCNLTFKTPQECNEHRLTHPNTCEICHKQFLKRDTLREHLLIHSAPRHQCPHCNKKFTQRSNLKRHIRVHTGEKPFRCAYCSRSFSDKSACNSHARVHTGYERSVCEICGASFSKKQRLNYHMRIHSGQGLLHCPLCPKSCTTSYAFRKHVESHLVPLTKALKSLGFGTLFQSDNYFLQNALQAIIQATLKGNCDKSLNINKKENDAAEHTAGDSIPLKHYDYRLETYKNKLSVFDVEIKKERVDLNVLEQCEVSKVKKNKPDVENLSIENLDSDRSTTSKFNLTKFLQCILEKESLKIRKKRKLRRRNHLLNFSEEVYPSFNDEECCHSVNDKEEELPETVGDELVKQCLEIVMKDENNWEEIGDEFDNSEYNKKMHTSVDQKYSSDQEILTESKKMHRNLMISGNSERIIPSSNEVIEGNVRASEQFADTPNLPAVQRIPKLKISRVSCKKDNDLSKGIFISELIEKD